MAEKPTELRSLDTTTNPAEPPAPAPTGAEALSRAMESERDQMLVALRQMRARLEGIAVDASLPPELQTVADRALSDLAAAEARCMGQRPSFLSVTDLAATVGAVEKLAASLARDTAAARERANSPEAQQQRLRTSLAAMHHDLFEKKILDPYLRFESAGEEEEYRKRERERKGEVERLQKIGTPEALQKVAALQKDQIQDAGQHGATASPDFKRIEAQADQNLAEATTLLARSTQEVRRTDKGSDGQLAAIRDVLASAGVVPQDAQESANSPPLAIAAASNPRDRTLG